MSLIRRLAAAVFGLWFTLAVAEPVSLHACAMHDGAPASAMDAGEHAGHHGDHQAPDDDSTGGHACLCLGACSASAPLSVASAVEVPVAVVAAVATFAPTVAPDASPRAAAVRLLPWPNGPPTISA